MRVRVSGAATLAVLLLPLAGAAALAQTPASPPPPGPLPAPGFMPPYEIANIARSAGFEPLAPPLREGATYVLRATDFRGILMRVVVDAHSGAIRAVNRIVPGPGAYAPIGIMPPPYEMPPPYGRPPPYRRPPSYEIQSPYEEPDFKGAATMPRQESAAVPAEPVPARRVGSRPSLSAFPPLPRPRPAELVSRKAAGDTKSGAVPTRKSGAKADAANTAPAAPPASGAAPLAPSTAPAPAPLND